jgi:hypothetical protein
MSDLHDAVQAEIDAYSPAGPLSFDALKDRARSRTRRRGGVAVVVVALVAAGLAFLPDALGWGEPDAPSFVPAVAAMPGIPGSPEDVLFVRICLSSNADECRSILDARALSLARAFADAVPLDPEDSTCRSLSAVYYVQFESRSRSRAEPITLPFGCAYLEVGGRQYAVTDALRDQVTGAYATPPWAGVATIVDQCVGYDRAQPLKEYLGLSTADADRLATAQGFRVRVLGDTGPCWTDDNEYLPGRLTLVVNEGKTLYAAEL